MMAGVLRKIFKQREKRQPGRCSFVIAAAGVSERMKGQNKLFALVGGVPILARTLIAIEKCEMVSEIIVVTRSEDLLNVSELCRDFSINKVTKIICGGETRLESVLIGISEVSPKAKLIGIHDGARPFITSTVIMKTIKAAAEFGAAAPAVPVSDTVKHARNNIVTSTIDRDQLFAVQTPQIFLPELIKGA
jgi:2-C-methyl-D-erythritol 4-phosphate cytidylyltransferase